MLIALNTRFPILSNMLPSFPFCQINNGIHIHQFTFKLVHALLFLDVDLVSDLIKNIGGSTDLVKKRHGSTDMHTPIHPSPI